MHYFPTFQGVFWLTKQSQWTRLSICIDAGLITSQVGACHLTGFLLIDVSHLKRSLWIYWFQKYQWTGHTGYDRHSCWFGVNLCWIMSHSILEVTGSGSGCRCQHSMTVGYLAELCRPIPIVNCHRHLICWLWPVWCSLSQIVNVWRSHIVFCQTFSL